MVARRRKETGIRIGLGASRANVMRLVLREATMLIVTGLVIVSALAIVVARTASSLLYGLKPGDPLTVGLADGLLAAGAKFASLLPALRAARLEPSAAPRQ